MDRVAYSIKGFFNKFVSFFHSTGFLKVYDKVVKWLKILIPRLLTYAALIAFSYVFMFPILRVFIDSLKTEADLVNPDIVWVPTSLTLKSYKNAISALWISRTWNALEGAWMSTLLNSILYSTLSAVIETFVACLAGYAFARFEFKGKKLLFVGLIIGFVIPLQLLIIPRKMMLVDIINYSSSASSMLGMKQSTAAAYHVDGIFSFITTLPLLLITALGQGINSSILIFIFYSFFKMIPVALDEAAQIDGANFWQIFYHVIIKMSTTSILVVFLFAFIWNWNNVYVLDKMMAISTNSLGFKTITQQLGSFNYVISQGDNMSGVTEDGNNSGLKSSAIIISILPLIILYAFTQRKFVEGIENTGVTGV